jgi:hypothetical protein
MDKRRHLRKEEAQVASGSVASAKIKRPTTPIAGRKPRLVAATVPSKAKRARRREFLNERNEAILANRCSRHCVVRECRTA